MSDFSPAQQPGLDEEPDETGNRRKVVLFGVGAAAVVGALAAGFLFVPGMLGSGDSATTSTVAAGATKHAATPTPSPTPSPSASDALPDAGTLVSGKDPFKPLLVAAAPPAAGTSTGTTNGTGTTTTGTGTTTTGTPGSTGTGSTGTLPPGDTTGTGTGTGVPTGGTGGTTQPPAAHVMNGTLTVYSPTPALDSTGARMPAGECVPAGSGYSDIHNGTAVAVRGSRNTVLGRTTLKHGTLVDVHTEQMPVMPSDPTVPPDQWKTKPVQVGFCRFTFAVPGLQDSEYYSIAVAKRSPLAISEHQLELANWSVKLTLG